MARSFWRTTAGRGKSISSRSLGIGGTAKIPLREQSKTTNTTIYCEAGWEIGMTTINGRTSELHHSNYWEGCGRGSYHRGNDCVPQSSTIACVRRKPLHRGSPGRVHKLFLHRAVRHHDDPSGADDGDGYRHIPDLRYFEMITGPAYHVCIKPCRYRAMTSTGS